MSPLPLPLWSCLCVVRAGRFVAFIAGSFAAVLLLASVVDLELFLHFEITPHRTVAFYLTVFGTILAAARGMIPEENQVFDPELLMTEVVQYTHYMPDEWRDQLHSKKVFQCPASRPCWPPWSRSLTNSRTSHIRRCMRNSASCLR